MAPLAEVVPDPELPDAEPDVPDPELPELVPLLAEPLEPELVPEVVPELVPLDVPEEELDPLDGVVAVVDEVGVEVLLLAAPPQALKTMRNTSENARRAMASGQFRAEV